MKSVLTALTLGIVFSSSISAQAEQPNRVYWPQHSWAFRMKKVFPTTYQLFNAFDLGHGTLYENLLRSGGQNVPHLEVKTFNELVPRLIEATRPGGNNAFRFPLDPELVAPTYSRLAWRAVNVFEWTHTLHARMYDILVDDRLNAEGKKKAIDKEMGIYYGRAKFLTFTRECKDMELMDGQYYSMIFREMYPKFNDLIWAYHWLQMAVYEPLMESDSAVRAAQVTQKLLRFARTVSEIVVPGEVSAEIEAKRIAFMRKFSFTEGVPDTELGPDKTIPLYEMPMSHMSAPKFTKAYPELAAIFDNLHMMHDVISDILVSTKVVGKDTKKKEIYTAFDNFQDPKKYIVECMGAGHEGPVHEQKLLVGAGKFTPATIHVTLGKKVKLTLQSQDIAHGIMIPEYGFKLEVGPGESKTGEFLPPRKGTFQFYDPTDPRTTGTIMIMD